MKIQRVYVDTSVIGGCFDKEFDQWSLALIQNFRDGVFKPLFSEVLAIEIEKSPDRVQALYAELLTFAPEILSLTTESVDLANLYQKQGILTPKYYDDCMHISLATIADADVLVSWNFKHIVKLEKIRLFNAVNLTLGYKSLQIYSPREVAIYEDDN